MEYSTEEPNFWDVNTKLIDGERKTDLFVKPTDKHQFLNPSSCHPYHCKKGTFYSQASRLNKICSDNEDFERRCIVFGEMAYGKRIEQKNDKKADILRPGTF